jgi:hypothetical protein
MRVRVSRLNVSRVLAGASGCTSCPAGSYYGSNGAPAACLLVMTHISLSIVLPEFWRLGLQALVRFRCTSHWATVLGASACTSCAAGFYTGSNGASAMFILDIARLGIPIDLPDLTV